MKFYKLNGIGNDYIFIYSPTKQLESNIYSQEMISWISDRHFGIGGDGLVLIDKISDTEFFMRIFNSDGSEANTCGNALRCIALLLDYIGELYTKQINIRTKCGTYAVRIKERNGIKAIVSVNMGKPEIFAGKCPNEALSEGYIFVNVGNPHAVKVVDCMCTHELQIAQKLSKEYPGGINVEVVKLHDDGSASVRVFERGTGETLACGSGATAVAFVLKSIYQPNIEKCAIHLLGGTLEADFSEDRSIVITGRAALNYIGELPKEVYNGQN